MQHVYAASIAFSVTCVLAVGILYFDYGFWHDTYTRKEQLEVSYKKTEQDVQEVSPKSMLGDFLHEASNRLETISVDRKNFLEGREVYEGATTTETVPFEQ